jgi:lysophospholipase L1-like esterase/Mg-chelatase subunit ChlD
VLLATLCAVIPAAARPTSAAAQASASASAPQIVVVFDTSSSMSEDGGGGVTRLDGAKRALLQFVDDVPKDTRVGLFTFPGDGDCAAGRATIGAPGALPLVDPQVMGSTIRGLQANGNTPTGSALREATKLFSGTGTHTIVLVSDGEENCGEDACAVARELAGTDIGLSIPTVGFQISDEGREALRCIAESTRSGYVDADDNARLIEELPDLAGAQLAVNVANDQTLFPDYSTGTIPKFKISATVTNQGQNVANDTRAILTFDVGFSPGVGDPRRRLGNLTRGEGSPAVDWSIRAPADFQDRTIKFTVTALARNAPPTSVSGSIVIKGSTTANDGGPLLRGKSRVAILGDSYSSGEGAPDFEQGTDEPWNACHRSDKTYGKVLYGDKAKNFACSGALARDIYLPNENNFTDQDRKREHRIPAQIASMEAEYGDEGPDLVVLTIGGNDVGFRQIIIACAFGIPPFQSGSCDEDADVETPFASRLNGLNSVLPEVYRKVDLSANSLRQRKGLPVAPIVVLGYPQHFPESPRANEGCPAFMNVAEMKYANGLASRLNERIRTIVEQSHRSGLPIYYSPQIKTMLPSHTQCAGTEKWINTIDTSDATLYATGAANSWFYGGIAHLPAGRKALDSAWGSPEYRRYQLAFHPNAGGYQAEANALVNWSVTNPGAQETPRRFCNCPDVVVANPQTKLEVTNGGSVSVTPGGQYVLQAQGLPAGGGYVIQGNSATIILAQGVVADDGTVEVPVVIPSGFPMGAHMLRLIAADDAGELTELATSMEVRKAPLPLWSWLLLVVGMAGLAAGGMVLLVLRRTRTIGAHM